jgi:hypothetical protein
LKIYQIKKQNDKVNILGLILRIGDLRQIKSPYKNVMSSLRAVSLIDTSFKRINCTLWSKWYNIVMMVELCHKILKQQLIII